MKLDLEEVSSAISILEHVPMNPAIESSQYIRMAQGDGRLSLSLTGTLWAHAAVKTMPTTEKWEFFADRKMFKTFISTAQGSELEVKFKDGALTLIAGQRLNIPSHAPITGYTTSKFNLGTTLTDYQQDALSMLVKYCPLQPGLENTAAIAFLKGYGVVATDTIVIAVILDANQAENFFIPSEAASMIKAFGASQISADKHGIGVSQKSKTFIGSAYQPLSSELDKHPIDGCKKIIAGAKAAKTLVTLNAAELEEACGAMSEFMSSNLNTAKVSWDKKTALFTVDCYGGKLERRIKAVTKGDIPESLWSIRIIAPWIAHYVSAAAKSQGVGEFEYARIAIPSGPGANVLRLTLGGNESMLIFVDV